MYLYKQPNMKFLLITLCLIGLGLYTNSDVVAIATPLVVGIYIYNEFNSKCKDY